ncbi:MAG: Sua5 family C-terminal domain-containing protein [Dehalococcoidia bacterium]
MEDSTALDLIEDPPVLLRPGGVPQETLETVIGKIRTLERQPNAGRRSPGTRYRRYASRARLLLVDPGEAEALVARLLGEGRKVGVMTRRPVCPQRHNLQVRMMPQHVAKYAQELFAALRDLDAWGCEVIVAEALEFQGGLGLAIMDRLRRASADDEAGRCQR